MSNSTNFMSILLLHWYNVYGVNGTFDEASEQGENSKKKVSLGTWLVLGCSRLGSYFRLIAAPLDVLSFMMDGFFHSPSETGYNSFGHLF